MPLKIFSGLGRHADPPFPGGFLLMGSGLRASRKSGRTRGLSARYESVHQDCAGSNPTGHRKASTAFTMWVARSAGALYPTHPTRNQTTQSTFSHARV